MTNQPKYKFARSPDGVIELELVLGAGGVKGYLHIGLLKGLAEFCAETGTKIRITKVTGVSVGAIIAALFTNGWSWERILQLFLDAHDRAGNPLLLASAFAMPSMRSFLVGWSFLSLERPWDKFVKENNITGNDQLRLVAADSETHEAVLFEGKDMPVGTGLSASGSLPGVFLPVAYGKRLLIDGAAYHRNPDEFCQRHLALLSYARNVRSDCRTTHQGGRSAQHANPACGRRRLRSVLFSLQATLPANG
jgi:NTE family protein